MGERIPKPKAGQKFNRVGIWRRLFQRVNALSNLEIKPSGVARLNVAGDKAIMTFSADAFAGAGTDDSRYIELIMTIAGDFPTPAEVTTALQAAYTSSLFTPRKNDLVALKSGVDTIIFFYRIWNTPTGDRSYWSRNFTVGSETYGATGWQTGLV